MNYKIFDFEPEFLVIDLFCGAGGVTTGFEESMVAKVIACVNHDYYAIRSHAANHKDTKHFAEDIKVLNLDELVEIVNFYRKLYPNAKIILHASLECTNFSKAKGGLAREADSRTLADHMHRYIVALHPDMVTIENVTEFRDWGPIRIKAKHQYADRTELTIIKDKHGKLCYGWAPIQELKGTDFKRWCDEMCAHGYVCEWVEMNSADYGAFTSRNRLFGMFARTKGDLVFPEPTHCKRSKLGKPGNEELLLWNAVKEKIDFTDEGYSILHRGQNMDIPARQRKDLEETTLERVYEGLIKHVAGGKKNFLLKYNSMSQQGKHVPPSVDDPCPVISTQSRLGIVQPIFMSKYHNGSPETRNNSLNDPLGVIDTENRHAVIGASFLVQQNGNNHENRNISIEEPARTLTSTGGKLNLVNAFISTYHGNGHNTHSVEGPGPVIPTKDSQAIVQTSFIDMAYGVGFSTSIDHPVGTVTVTPKMNLVQAEMSFIDTTNYNNVPASVNEPHPVITADRHYPCILNLAYGGQVSSVQNPSFTIVATQHKSPLYLVITESGNLAIQIYETDSPFTRKIKEFMALYGITDIKMRMLKVKELLEIQGFPKGYNLMGTVADQKKFIGNSVVPDVMRAWALAMSKHYNARKAA